MKKSTFIFTNMILAVLFLLGSSYALAQPQQVNQQDQAQQNAQMQQPGQQGQQQMQLQGMQVTAQTGESLGTVEKAVRDNTGNLRYVIISTGQGQNRITIPAEKINQQGNQLNANVNFAEINQYTGVQEGQQALNQVLGKSVQGTQGEELGTITNIVIGDEAGTYVILTDENQEKYPVPLQALQQQQGRQGFRLDQDKQNFQTAPSYAQNFPDLEKWRNVIHGYYIVQPQEQVQEQSQQQHQARQDEADILIQSSPKVIVKQTQPEILVRQPQPEVLVSQRPPQVQVTQPEPQVRVTVPPPRIEVFQPEPIVEVIQPEPQIQVEQQQPEISVNVPPPQVQVRQPEPDVAIAQSQPQVQIEKSQPQVRVQKQGQPEVIFQRQGQAQVNVERQGQAQVRVERQGEPQVRVVKRDQSQARSLAQAEPNQAQNWVDRPILDNQGQEVGTVAEIVLAEDRDGVAYILVRAQDDQIHPVPADMLRMDSQNQTLMAVFDRQFFQQSPGFTQQQQQQMARGDWEQQVRGYYQEQQGGQFQQYQQDQGQPQQDQ